MNKKSMVRSLNALEQDDLIYYWCNSSGEINKPGASAYVVGKPDDMPIPVKKLYEQFQSEDYGLSVYTVTVDGKYGMALVARYSRDAIREDVENGVLPPITEAMFHYAVETVGRRLADEDDEGNFTVYHGVNTDEEGDELLFFLPMDRIFDDTYNNPIADLSGEDRFTVIAQHLDAEAYGHLFTQALDDAVAAARWLAETYSDLKNETV